jgi:hypothetical protein
MKRHTTIQEFKVELRTMGDDPWGVAMLAFFECAGQLHSRKVAIPEDWEYTPGLCPIDKDSPFYSIFENTSTLALGRIGNFLNRYCQFLKFKKVDY